MNHIIYKLLLVGTVLSLSAASTCAQLRIKVEAPSEVDINDAYFQVRYTIPTASAEGIEGGNFSNFDVLSGPNVSVSSYTVSSNRQVHSSQSTTYTYTLAPHSKGTFHIPPVTIKAGGKAYHSASVTIRVSGTGNRPAATRQRGTNADGGQAEQLRVAGSKVGQSDLFIRAKLGRSQVYEQEAVPLTYYFYERPGTGLNSVGLSQKPDFKGMVSQEIPLKGIEATTARVNGQTYRSGIVQQYVLFPQQTGTLSIPAITFDCVVMQHEAGLNPYDAFFNGGGNIGVALKRQSSAEQITVKPLPSPKPAGFSGGVGHFQATGELLTPTVCTNDMMTYRITIKGNGNLKLLTAPSITFPTDFDSYSPKTTDRTEVTADGLTGEMMFDYTFVPRNVGHYEVPESRFIYFDPSKGGYETIILPAIKLDVKKGKRSDADLERDRLLRSSDIHDIHTGDGQLRSVTSYYRWGTPEYWAVYVVAMLLFSGAAIALRHYRSVQNDAIGLRRNKAAKTAVRRLKAAKLSLGKGDAKAFYAELEKALTTYMADKLSVATAELGQERLKTLLAERGLEEAHIEAWLKLCEDCNYARFAPANDEKPETLYERASAAIAGMEHDLEQQRKKRPAKKEENVL